MTEQPPLVTVPDVAAWRGWLDTHEASSNGIWLLLAKKGTTHPTSLTYQDALLEALCSGWIDGQSKSIDHATYKQRFTPRRARSIWSQRNVGLVARLEREGRMRERGRAEVRRAQEDGRWERAYAGSSAAVVPDDFAAALAAVPGGTAAFDSLSRSARFTLLHPIMTAASPEVRARRIGRAVERTLGESNRLPE